MMNPFKQGAALKKMYDIQRELQKEEVTVEKNGVKVVITGDQKIKSLSTNDSDDSDIRDAINEAIKKSQEVAARKLSQMGGGLGGLLGQ